MYRFSSPNWKPTDMKPVFSVSDIISLFKEKSVNANEPCHCFCNINYILNAVHNINRLRNAPQLTPNQNKIFGLVFYNTKHWSQIAYLINERENTKRNMNDQRLGKLENPRNLKEKTEMHIKQSSNDNLHEIWPARKQGKLTYLFWVP